MGFVAQGTLVGRGSFVSSAKLTGPATAGTVLVNSPTVTDLLGTSGGGLHGMWQAYAYISSNIGPLTLDLESYLPATNTPLVSWSIPLVQKEGNIFKTGIPFYAGHEATPERAFRMVLQTALGSSANWVSVVFVCHRWSVGSW